MADDEEGGGEEGAPAWMATFADLMSLLLTFFVLLLSFSTMDSIKFMGMVGSVRYAFGVKDEQHGRFVGLDDDILRMEDGHPEERQVLDNLAKKLKKSLSRSGLNSEGVAVSVGIDGVRLRVPGDLLFSGGTSVVSPRAFSFLDDVAVRTRTGSWEIKVEGHADRVGNSRSAFLDNWRLSADRAIATVEYLAQAGRVPRKQLSVASFGDTRPLTTNKTEEGRKKNRRVELLFRPPDQKKLSPR